MPEDCVRQLVDQHIEGRMLGPFGEPLALNPALDRVCRAADEGRAPESG